MRGVASGVSGEKDGIVSIGAVNGRRGDLRIGRGVG